MFSYQKAMALLPEIISLLKTAIEAKASRKRSVESHAAYKKKLVMAGGAFPNQNRLAAYADQAKTSHEELKRAVDRIQDQGVEIRDLDQGQIDFPARYRDKQVYLCFQLGEAEIVHWHGADEGCAGRKAIDPAFLSELDFS